VYGDDSDAFQPYTTVDISQRTRAPTPLPTSVPTPLPTVVPSPRPTALPTTVDTVKVSFALTLSGADAVDLVETNPAALVAVLAQTLNLTAAHIKNLRLGNITTVDDSAAVRRLAMAPPTLPPSYGPLHDRTNGGRGPNLPRPRMVWSEPTSSKQALARKQQLAAAADEAGAAGVASATNGGGGVRGGSGDAAVAAASAAFPVATSAAPATRALASTTYVIVKFDVVTDLAEAGFKDAASFLEATTATLAAAVASGALETSLEAACGCDVSAESVSFLVSARYPTLNPTPLPTPAPTPSPTPATCSYEFLTCGTSVVDNNFHHGICFYKFIS